MDNDRPELGFVFHTLPGASLGYAQLDVFLVGAGLDDGFAAAELSLPAWDPADPDSIARLVLTTAWPGPGEIRVAPGFVTIISYGGGQQESYCFGGVLTCQHDGNPVANHFGPRLDCRITSSAPILNLSEEGPDSSENAVFLVVNGLESQIAAARTGANSRAGTAFDRRLAQADPNLLYAVGLTQAHVSLDMVPDILRTDHYWEEHNYLSQALHEAQSQDWWPSDPSLAAVLPVLPD